MATKHLADARVKEAKIRANFYTLQAQKAAENLGEAELDVGRVSMAIRKRQLYKYPTPAQALRKYGDFGEFHSVVLVALPNVV
jgi:hypothetical protein